MMLVGKIEKSTHGLWAADCELIGAHTQGTSRSDAREMLADCIEVQTNRRRFKVTVTEGRQLGEDAYEVIVDSDQPAVLGAELLKYQRLIHKLTLRDVQKKLGASSINAYAAYEQGKRAPTLAKFRELLAAVAPDMVLTVGPRKAMER